MTFTITPLISGGYLVEGTDSRGTTGQTTLHSEKWDALVAVREHKKAMKKFNKRTLKFFKPLTDAAAEAQLAVSSKQKNWNTVVVEEGVEGKQAHVIVLDEDGTLLRILDACKFSNLRWINDGKQLIALKV